jgi:hypothetical protein
MAPKKRSSINYLVFMVLALMMLLMSMPFSVFPMSPINQQLDMKCTKTDELLGPHAIDILDNKSAAARVVLLSDVHIIDRSKYDSHICRQSIVPYLANLFRNYQGTKDIDFFLEIDFEEKARGIEEYDDFKNIRQSLLEGKDVKGGYGYLLNLRAYFNDCFQQSKGQCEYNGKHIRFHHADVRSGVLHSKTNKEAETVIQTIHEGWNIMTREKVPSSRYIAAIEKVALKCREQDIDFLFHISKIDKQLAKLPNNLSNALYDMMRAELETKTKEIDELFRRIETIRKYVDAVHHGTINQQILSDHVQNTLYFIKIALFWPLFDIYTLARMARHDMKQVIIYAGSKHIGNIRKFLLDHMNYQITKSTSMRDKCGPQCTEMQNIPQPWFEDR